LDRDALRTHLFVGVALLRRRWGWFALTLLGSLAVGGAVLSLYRNPFRATSIVVARNAPGLGGGMSDLLAAAGIKGGGGPSLGASQNMSLDATAKQIMSRFNWAAAQARLRTWRGRNGERLTTPIGETEYFKVLAVDSQMPDQLLVRGTHQDRVRALAVSEVAAEVGVEASMREARADWQRVTDYAKQLLPQIERDMQQANQQMADFQKSSKLYDGINSMKLRLEALYETLSELNKARVMAQGAGRQLEELRGRARKEGVALTFQASEEDPVVNRLREELSKAHGELIRARTDFEDDSSEVTAANTLVTEAQRTLTEHLGRLIQRPRTELDPARISLMSELIKTQGEKHVAEAAVQAYSVALQQSQQQLEEVTGRLGQWQSLSQRAKVKESSYLVYLAKLQEATVNAAVQPGQLRLVDLAGVAVPSGLPRSRLAVLVCVLAVLFGVGAAALADLLADRVATSAEAESLTGLPVLGALPSTREAEPALSCLHRPSSSLAEAARMLAVNVRHVGAGRVLLVTSPGASEGKTTVAVNLAVALARGGQRVVLVEGNLRAPALQRLWPGGEGLTRYLINGDPLTAALQSGPVENLSVLTVGARTLPPPELLESSRLSRLLEELRAQCDLVVFDGPGVLATADARLLAARAEATLLVAQANATPRSELALARQIIEGVGGRVIGLALNRATMTRVLTRTPVTPAEVNA